MYRVTFQSSPRRRETVGYYYSREVADHIAVQQMGCDELPGTVEEIEVCSAITVEEYEESLREARELQERQQWAEWYEQLSPVHKHLMQKYGASFPVEVSNG